MDSYDSCPTVLRAAKPRSVGTFTVTPPAYRLVNGAGAWWQSGRWENGDAVDELRVWVCGGD